MGKSLFVLVHFRVIEFPKPFTIVFLINRFSECQIINIMAEFMRNCSIELCGPNGIIGRRNFIGPPSLLNLVPSSSQPIELQQFIRPLGKFPGYSFGGCLGFKIDTRSLQTDNFRPIVKPPPDQFQNLLLPGKLSENNKLDVFDVINRQQSDNFADIFNGAAISAICARRFDDERKVMRVNSSFEHNRRIELLPVNAQIRPALRYVQPVVLPMTGLRRSNVTVPASGISHLNISLTDSLIPPVLILTDHAKCRIKNLLNFTRRRL